MKTILTFVAAALVFSITMTESAEAKGGSKSSGVQKSSGMPKSSGGQTAGSYRNTKNLGNQFHGTFHGQRCLFKGYKGWTRYCWMPRFGCYGYYCPQFRGWFYMYQRGNCYLPLSCMTTFAPTPVAAPPMATLPETTPLSGDVPLPEGALPLEQMPMEQMPEAVR
jgi:hypothetical protein